MNTLHNVGKQVSSFEQYDQLDPITGIWLFVGEDRDEDLYKAGNETGTVLEVYCPYGNQTMANTLLSQLQGQVYAGFRAQNAVLSPAAELGDWVAVNGGTYMLAYRSVTFGPGHMAEIAAPGESTQEHEYGWTSPENRKTTYNQARSMISKTNKEIQLAIYGEDGKGGLNGKMATFTVSLSTIGSKVESVETKAAEDLEAAKNDFNVTLKNYSTIEQTAQKIATEVKSVKEYTDGKVSDLDSAVSLKLVSYSTVEQTDQKIATRVAKGSIISEINQSAETVQISASKINLNGYVTFTSLSDEPTGTLTIDGGWLHGQTISSAIFTGGEYWDDKKIGCLDLSLNTTTVDGKEVTLPWLTYSAINSKKQAVNLFEVKPLTANYEWIGLFLGDTLALDVWDGVVSLSSAWNMVAGSKNYGEDDPPETAVEGQVYFKLIS